MDNTKIEAWAFAETGITEAVIPEGVTTICTGAFSETSLREVEIPEGVTCIGTWAFFGCRDLQRVRLPRSLKQIGDAAFAGCTALREIVIPDSVSYIGDRAFCGCAELQMVQMPEVFHLGDFILRECDNLVSVIVEGKAYSTEEWKDAHRRQTDVEFWGGKPWAFGDD